MSAWENAVVTNKGIELQGKILASAPLEITKVVASTDNPNITQLVNLTAITDIKQNLSVQQFGYTENGTAALRVLLSNQELTSSYVCHLIGIYAKDTDGEEILYAVAHSTDGDSIPSITEQPNGYTCEWCFNLTFSNSENISVSIDSAAFVTIGAADARYAAIVHQHSFDDIENNLGSLLSDNLLFEPLFDAHSHRGALGTIASIYPDDTGLIDICTFWKAKISANESIWSARVYDCTYGDQTIKALFIRHPDEPTSALDGVYQVLELPSTDSFTATIKLTFYAQVRDDDTPESTTFTIRPYISNTLAAVNGTNNGVTIPNDGAWHKVEVQGTVSNGTIYVVLDSFQAAEAAQHWFHIAMPKAEIVSLSDGVHLLQTAKDAYFTKTDADLRTKIAAVEEKLETVLAAFQGVWLRLDVDAFASMTALGSNDWNNLYIHYNPLNGSWTVYADEYINVAADFSTGDVIGTVLPQYRPSAVLTGTARIKIYQEDEAKDCTCQVKPDGSIVIAPELTPGLNVITLYELTLSYDTTEANT